MVEDYRIMQNRDKLQEHVGVEYSTFTQGKQSLLSCKLGYAADNKLDAQKSGIMVRRQEEMPAREINKSKKV
jgi:hypothetical protein